MNTLEELRSGKLLGSRRLKLACGLTEFPSEIFSLAETLEVLDLSGNALSTLPAELPRLHQLRILFCSDNQFTRLPDVLGQCQQLRMIGFKANRIDRVPGAALPLSLRWLILTDNRISQLPAEIGRCTHLQKLMLAGNRLTALPPEMAACTRLELLRIAANRFAELPGWLLALPRLAWLAYAGNPFCENAELAETPIARVAWDQLQVGPQLGEGASGVIHQADWQQDDGRYDVAVKLFKGALTSDGLPRHEMAACIGAGEHPNLITVHGKIDDHPTGAEGLVMALIDSDFRNLAGPPSLESCTRDVYAADASFAPGTALRIALGVASAAGHLHAQGIMHGDLYGHNILHCAAGNALLGDFGAASFLATDDQHQTQALQRLEVRAFSCLLAELLERCQQPAGTAAALAALSDLQARCAQETSAERPLFTEIVEVLQAISVEVGQ